MRTIAFGTLAAALALCSTARAQVQGADVILCETTNDQLAIFTDANSDATYVDAEIRSLYNDGTGGGNVSSPRAVKVRMEGAYPVAYWVDTVMDVVYRGVDLDGDTVISIAEAGIFRDVVNLDGAISPRGIALSADNAVWWTNDYSSGPKGLFWGKDLNADGDCEDAGEYYHMVDGSMGITVPASGGPAVINGDNYIKCTQVNDNGMGMGVGAAVYSNANSFGDAAYYVFRDANADGDVQDAGEALTFLDYSNKNTATDQNPDFAAAGPGSNPRSLQTGSNPDYWVYMTFLTTGVESGVDAYYFASDRSSSHSFPQNIYGEWINGVIYRGVDNNLDGDVNDAGEVKLWYDGGGTSPGVSIDKIVGIGWDSGYLYVADLGFGALGIHRFKDNNLDGDAQDAGEQEFYLWDATLNPASSVFINGSPFIQDIGVGPAEFFTGGFLPTFYCTGKTSSETCVPYMDWTGTASATSTGPFKCIGRDVLGSTIGILLYSNKKGAMPDHHGGKLCIKSPFKRTPGKAAKSPSNGVCVTATGRYVFDFQNRIQGGSDASLTAGANVFVQFRGRDVADPSGFGDSLTNGMKFTIEP